MGVCLGQGKLSDTDPGAVLWAGSAGDRQLRSEGRQADVEGMPLPADADGLLSQALLLGELGPAVELCLKEERFADAIILAQAGGADLLKKTQERYLAKKKTRISLVTAHHAGGEEGLTWTLSGGCPHLGTGVLRIRQSLSLPTSTTLSSP